MLSRLVSALQASILAGRICSNEGVELDVPEDALELGEDVEVCAE